MIYKASFHGLGLMWMDLDLINVKKWKYVPLNPKGLNPIPTWQDMHNKNAMVSLKHDQVPDVVRECM